MNVYILLYLIMIGGFLLFQSLEVYQIEENEGKLKYRVKPLIAIIAVIPLIYFAWHREQYFGDTGIYFMQFEEIPHSLGGLSNYLGNHPKDPGFTIFEWIIKTIGLDIRAFFLIIGLIQGLTLAYIYRKYSSNYFLSILLFFLSSDYYSWMQNGIRQFLAVSIIFAATPLILKKQFIPTILIVLLASSFHQSALIMLPVIFIIQGVALNKRMLLFTIGLLLAVIFLSAFTDLLDSFLQNTQYENVVSDYQVGEFADDNGANPLRVLFYSIPLLLSCIGLKKIRKVNSPILNLSVNMAVLTSGIYLLSMFSSGIFIGRIPIYFSLYNYILLPWEIRELFKKNQIVILTVAVIILYFIFGFIQVNYIWNLF